MRWKERNELNIEHFVLYPSCLELKDTKALLHLVAPRMVSQHFNNDTPRDGVELHFHHMSQKTLNVGTVRL